MVGVQGVHKFVLVDKLCAEVDKRLDRLRSTCSAEVELTKDWLRRPACPVDDAELRELLVIDPDLLTLKVAHDQAAAGDVLYEADKVLLRERVEVRPRARCESNDVTDKEWLCQREVKDCLDALRAEAEKHEDTGPREAYDEADELPLRRDLTFELRTIGGDRVIEEERHDRTRLPKHVIHTPEFAEDVCRCGAVSKPKK